MNGLDLPVPASTTARLATSTGLIAVTAMVLNLVLQFNLEAQALPAGGDAALAQIKVHGFAVLLGVMAMINMAWFGALIRVQAAEARMKARPVAKSGRSVTE
jgi:hypothetical protein